MSIFTVTSDDTLTLWGRVFNDFADDDITTVAYGNDLVTVKTGKNKNTIFAKNEQGNNANVVLRLMKGSSDDQFMQGKLAAMASDFVATELATGQFVKRLGDGQGNVARDVYTLLGGVIVRGVDGKENASGDTNQAVSTYNMTFSNVVRSIQ